MDDFQLYDGTAGDVGSGGGFSVEVVARTTGVVALTVAPADRYNGLYTATIDASELKTLGAPSDEYDISVLLDGVALAQVKNNQTLERSRPAITNHPNTQTLTQTTRARSHSSGRSVKCAKLASPHLLATKLAAARALAARTPQTPGWTRASRATKDLSPTPLARPHARTVRSTQRAPTTFTSTSTRVTGARATRRSRSRRVCTVNTLAPAAQTVQKACAAQVIQGPSVVRAPPTISSRMTVACCAMAAWPRRDSRSFSQASVLPCW